MITITRIDAPKEFLSLVMQRALAGTQQNAIGGWARYEFHKINFDDRHVESFDLLIGRGRHRVDRDVVKRGIIDMLNEGWSPSIFNENITERYSQIVLQFGLFGYLKYGIYGIE